MADTQTSEWMLHDGKGKPVPSNSIVLVKFRDGGESIRERADAWTPSDEDTRNYWVFSTDRPYDDIIAYRVVKP